MINYARRLFTSIATSNLHNIYAPAIANRIFLFFLFQYANIRIGPVVKRDVMKASTMLVHDSQ